MAIGIAVRHKEGEKTPTRTFSSKQEKQIAKTLNAKQTPNSGATAFNKGDVTTDSWLIECKTTTTEKKSFSIKKDWLEKNKEEGLYDGAYKVVKIAMALREKDNR